MKGKKGQAAVEYLLTYGWAILLLVVVIGAIFASGILTPSYFIAEECYLGPNLPCNFQVYSDQTTLKTYVLLDVTNGFPYTVKLSSFKINQQDITGEISPMGWTTDGLTIPSGDNKSIKFEIDKLYSNGELKKFGTSIDYVSCAKEINEKCQVTDALNHEISGRIIARIIAVKT